MNSTEDPRADTPSDAGGLASLTAIYLQQTTSLSSALIDMWSAWVQAADVVSRERACRYPEGTLVFWLRARRSWVTALRLGWHKID
jgi:hypothetical protein